MIKQRCSIPLNPRTPSVGTKFKHVLFKHVLFEHVLFEHVLSKHVLF